MLVAMGHIAKSQLFTSLSHHRYGVVVLQSLLSCRRELGEKQTTIEAVKRCRGYKTALFDLGRKKRVCNYKRECGEKNET